MEKEEKKKNNWYKILDYAWVILAIFAFIATIKYLNDGTLQTKVAAFGLWAPLVIIVLKISTLVFAPLGGTPIYIIAGAIYGPMNGFFICLIGDIIGSVICFLISRRYGIKVVEFFVGSGNMGKVKKAFGLLENTRSFIKARIAFISIPELLAYAAGLSNIGFWKFLILHIPLYIPFIFALVFLGSVVAVFTVKYAIFISLAAFIVASIGIWTLSRDYRKIEGT